MTYLLRASLYYILILLLVGCVNTDDQEITPDSPNVAEDFCKNRGGVERHVVVDPTHFYIVCNDGQYLVSSHGETTTFNLKL